jgi:hypothetical protein
MAEVKFDLKSAEVITNKADLHLKNENKNRKERREYVIGDEFLNID